MGLISYVGAHGDATGDRPQRGARLLAFSFFLGVTTSLLVLGTTAAWFGKMLAQWSATFAIVAALVSIGAGAFALFGPLLRRHMPKPIVEKRGGAVGALLYGLSYSVATLTTSAGPLTLILTIAAAVGKPLYGAVLSLAYGVGRGLPFLLAGLFAGRISEWLAPLERGRRAAEVVSGVALIGVGVFFLRLAFLLA